MQSVGNLGRDLFRIVFRRGSLQRVHYSNNRLAFALIFMLLALVAAQLLYFHNDALDAGLAVFVCITSLLIASSWLTWKVPRKRLMTAVLVVLLIAAIALALLAAVSPLPIWHQAATQYGFAGLLAGIVVLGTANALQFALASGRGKAFAYTGLFALAVVLLYTTLQGLLAVVFAA